MKSRHRSFADLADALGFSFGSRSSSRSSSMHPVEEDGVLSRAHSSVDLVRKSSYTRHKYVPHHLPTQLIIRILSFCDSSTLLSCLRVSRLFFNLAGTILYSSIAFETTTQMWGILKGSTMLFEHTTGRVAVGRRKFKDRLLRHTTEVTLHSHGDEDLDEDGCEGDGLGGGESLAQQDYFSFKRFSVLSLGSNSTSSKNSRPNTPLTSPPAPNVIPGDCPPVPLNGIMPRLTTLRIVLADAFDYHLLFCPRLSTCPLVEGLEVDKLVILDARSPLVVLPTAFPTTHRSSPSTPTPLSNGSGTTMAPASALVSGHARTWTLPAALHGLAASSNSAASARASLSNSALAILPPSLTVSAPASAPVPSKHHHVHKSSAPSPTTPSSAFHRSTGGLPIGLRELVIVLPTGRSYDAKDYEDNHHIFHHRHSVDALTRLSIVFLSPKGQGNPWQIAFYDSRSENGWTSYLCLAEDVAIAALSVSAETEVEIVGIEKLDGELLNMGVGVMKEGRAGKIMEDRIRRRMEVRLKAKARDGEVGPRMANMRFRALDEWIDGTTSSTLMVPSIGRERSSGRDDLGEEGLKGYE